MASRGAALKEMTASGAQDSRSANYLSSYQAYEDPKDYESKLAPESTDVDKAVAVSAFVS